MINRIGNYTFQYVYINVFQSLYGKTSFPYFMPSQLLKQIRGMRESWHYIKCDV
jgi:hypothetical protein